MSVWRPMRPKPLMPMRVVTNRLLLQCGGGRGRPMRPARVGRVADAFVDDRQAADQGDIVSELRCRNAGARCRDREGTRPDGGASDVEHVRMVLRDATADHDDLRVQDVDKRDAECADCRAGTIQDAGGGLVALVRNPGEQRGVELMPGRGELGKPRRRAGRDELSCLPRQRGARGEGLDMAGAAAAAGRTVELDDQWPISPAVPSTPTSGRPSMIAPPPTPVETVRYTTVPAPRAAPYRHSASTAAFVSRSRNVGRPTARRPAQQWARRASQPGSGASA